MEKINRINIELILICLVFGTIPLFMKVNNSLLAILFVFSLFYGKDRFKNYFINWRLALLIQGFFLLKIFGLTYSENLLIGIKKIETSLSFVIIPFIFFSRPTVIFNNRRYVYYSLICGTTIAIIISVIASLFSADVVDTYNSLTVSKYTYTQLISILEAHPTYMSLLIGASILLLINLNSKKQIDFKLYCLLLIIHIVFLFLLTSRTVLLYFAFIGLGYLLLNKKFLLFSTAIFMIFCIILLGIQNDYTKKRLYEPLELLENERVDRLKIHFSIFKESPIIGHGTGSLDELRNGWYIRMGRDYDTIVNYNAHNQLLEYLTSNGIVGGIFYLFSFIMLLFIAYRIKEYYLMIILGSILFSGISESNFERYVGVEAFSLFGSLLLVVYLEKMKK